MEKTLKKFGESQSRTKSRFQRQLETSLDRLQKQEQEEYMETKKLNEFLGEVDRNFEQTLREIDSTFTSGGRGEEEEE